jgi:hypothetical protein
MRKLLTFALLVFLSLFAFAQQKPEPWGYIQKDERLRKGGEIYFGRS